MSEFTSILSVARVFGLTACDVGARGGAKHDLDLLSSAVDCTLFEPEQEAYDRLIAQPQDGHWRSVRYVNTALAGTNGPFSLNLYRQRGCSSRFTADAALGTLFSRGEYYALDQVVEVDACTLDSLVTDGKVPSPDFIKIDVQGMEAEVFTGAAAALRDTVVGIRCEVSFFPIYPEQPLFAEIDQQLRPFGFVPLRWVEFHEWRRQSRAKYPQLATGRFPASYGQMIHADVLYLLHPEGLPCGTEAELVRLVRLGLVAACFGQVDHAVAAFSRPGVRELVKSRAAIDPLDALVPLSRRLARRARYDAVTARLAGKLAKLFRL